MLKMEGGISLEKLQWKGASSRVEGRISWVFLICGGKVGIPLELRRGAQGPTCGASGKSSLRFSCEDNVGSTLESREGDQASFRMAGGISMCFSSCGRKCGFPQVATGP